MERIDSSIGCLVERSYFCAMNAVSDSSNLVGTKGGYRKRGIFDEQYLMSDNQNENG